MEKLKTQTINTGHVNHKPAGPLVIVVEKLDTLDGNAENYLLNSIQVRLGYDLAQNWHIAPHHFHNWLQYTNWSIWSKFGQP